MMVVCRNENAVLQTCRPLVLSFQYIQAVKKVFFMSLMKSIEQLWRLKI